MKIKIIKLLIKVKALFKNRRQTNAMKPMGIRSTVYPEGYIPPVKRILNDGTIEYYIPVEAQKEIDNAWKKLGKETIKGYSLTKVICSDGGDEVEPIICYI